MSDKKVSVSKAKELIDSYYDSFESSEAVDALNLAKSALDSLAEEPETQQERMLGKVFPHPITEEPVEDKGYWWCPECKEPVDPHQVTFEECHEKCGRYVEWKEPVEEPVEESKPTMQEFQTLTHRHFDYYILKTYGPNLLHVFSDFFVDLIDRWPGVFTKTREDEEAVFVHFKEPKPEGAIADIIALSCNADNDGIRHRGVEADKEYAALIEERRALKERLEKLKAAIETYKNNIEEIAMNWRMDWSEFGGRMLLHKVQRAGQKLEARRSEGSG